MKLSREIKTAILVIAGVLLLVFMFNFLKGRNLFKDERNFFTEFDYNALSSSSPVTIKGNNVGKVEDIKYDFETGKTRVSFSVDPRLEFSKTSKIRLYETGIMGGNALAIIDSYEGEVAKAGDFIESEIQPGLVSSLKENFTGLSTNLDKTLRSADTLMISLNSLLNDDTEAGLKTTISELNKTLTSFRSLSFSIQDVVKQNDSKVASILENFDAASKDLTSITDGLKDVKIDETVARLDKTLDNVNSLMNDFKNGDGSMSKLLNDDKLYNNLEGASKELELLLLDIKLHPARYRRILSKREIPYEPPTEEQINNNKDD
ncbi:MlaD family protein [Winogradskyella maritima]|uniref:MlaD family protein n=1 Tax=Winogradskyella maritima TaxID=1517766 RepID=A0ABV8AK20_9FLAO|nr:MlaD family protein [Winogradskyella maritima]